MAQQATHGPRRAHWLLAGLLLASCENQEPYLEVYSEQAEGLGVTGSGPHVFAEERYSTIGVRGGIRFGRLRAPQAHPVDQELARALVRVHPEANVAYKPQGPQEPSSGASDEGEKPDTPHDGHGVWIDVMAWFIKTKWGPGQVMALGLLVLGFGMFCVAAVVYLRRRWAKNRE